MKGIIKEIAKKIGIKRKYNKGSYLLEYYWGKKKFYETFDKKYLGYTIEALNTQIVNQLYVLQNVLPDLHQKTFGCYKNSLEDKEVVLMASGPTLKGYTSDKYFQNAIHVGVNKTIAHFKDLDFYFMSDWTAIQQYGIEEKILDSSAKKFFGMGVLSDEYGTTSFATPLDFAKKCDASMYFSMHYASHQIIQFDISKHPLFGYGSIIIPAFHFALYCRPRRIYLVGCDCSTGGHFDDHDNFVMVDLSTQRLVEEWNRMALFAKYYSPDVEIISINPVGLKGLFKDEYR